ncbi:hypothetical protein MTO96_021385 [Rhipicephalus appendiculatus]
MRPTSSGRALRSATFATGYKGSSRDRWPVVRVRLPVLRCSTHTVDTVVVRAFHLSINNIRPKLTRLMVSQSPLIVKQFESPLPPRFRVETAAQLRLAKAGCRDNNGRQGRNCHTYSKGAGFSLANDGDSSRSPSAKSRSWRHVSEERGHVRAVSVARVLRHGGPVHAPLNTLIALLAKACMCRQTEHLRLLLATVAANNRFLRNVEQQLVCRRRLPAFWDQFVVPLVKVVEKSVKLLPREGKNNLCGVAAALLDLVNSSLQDTQPIDVNVVEAVESVGTLLAEANKLDFRRVVGRTHYASFPGDGDAGEKSSVLPAEFIQSVQLAEAEEVGSVRPATTTEYLRAQYSRLRQLFLRPAGKGLEHVAVVPGLG